MTELVFGRFNFKPLPQDQHFYLETSIEKGIWGMRSENEEKKKRKGLFLLISTFQKIEWFDYV